MKEFTNASRKITANDNFIVSVNEPLTTNRTAVIFFDEFANYRIGKQPSFVVEATSKRIAFTDKMKDRIKKYLDKLM